MDSEFHLNCPESSVISTILDAVKQITQLLRHSPVIVLQSTNKFGDTQLKQDVKTDQIVEKHLRQNKKVKAFASEERPEYHTLEQGDGYVVTYDPLDGSSIIDTNFSVGSIFSIWPTDQNKLIGTKLKSQANAMLSIYGPRTTAILYNSQVNKVQELTLIQGKWILSHEKLKIAAKTNMFCPGNLRAVTENEDYREVVNSWMNRQFTLRYTGGLVPDICQIFIKGHGIFANVASKSHKSKLRVLYQTAAVGYLIQKAGGETVTTGGHSLLEYQIKGYDDRMSFGAGSSIEIQNLRKLF